MKFMELTRYPEGRVLLNTANIASIYLGKRRLPNADYVDVTVIQETTSSDNYWEVVETIDEICAMLAKQGEK